MKYLNLALANITKAKSAAMSIFILIFIAGLLLNVCITVIFKMNTFYDDKVKELHDPHVSILMKHADYKSSYADFIKNYPGIKATEMEPVILMNGAQFHYSDSDLRSGIAMLNADASRGFSPLKLIEKRDTIQDNEIYVPYSFKASAGYKLGDLLTIIYQDKAYDYQIAGFFESTLLSTTNTSLMKFFLPAAAYGQLYDKLGEASGGILLSAELQDSKEATKLLNDYNKKFPDPSGNVDSPLFWETDIETMKIVGTIIINLVDIILLAFTVVIVLISLIVISFRVANNMDEGIVNIGVLKAVGYTSREILTFLILQFMLIALPGGIVGIAVSYAAIPVFGEIITSLSGLLWPQSFDAVINISSFFIIVLLVLAVTLLSSLRIWNIQPVEALRGGIKTHSFKKNLFPLERDKGGLQFLLACKTIVMNSKQNIMIVFIIVAVTFASIFSVVLYYNVATDKTAFVDIVGVETSNVIVQSESAADTEKLLAAFEHMDGVAGTAILDTVLTNLDGQNLYTNISNDYSKLSNQTVYEGRYPQYDNEIAVSWVVAKLLHKNIGDTVKVEFGGASYLYLITGLSQGISNLGQAAYLTLPGIWHIIPDYNGTMINVYLKGIDNTSFIQDLKAQYGSITGSIIDVDESIDSQSSIYIKAVFAIMVMIVAITILVVVLVLYLVIKSMILKRKREFGILRAIGHTTFQLMTQITLSFLPIVLTGVTIGGVLGCLFTNPLLTMLLSGAGIHNVQFIVKIPLIVMLCVGIIVLAYLVSMLVARRVKHISAYGFITE